jgi:hypothetical protein
MADVNLYTELLVDVSLGGCHYWKQHHVNDGYFNFVSTRIVWIMLAQRI